ncbi:MAG: proton-conducting transporter membrane subunit [Gemmatimonadota bacterium]
MTMILLAVACVLAGGASTLLFRRSPRLADRAYAVLLLAGAAIGLSVAVTVLRGGAPSSVTLPGSLPGGPWVFGLDPLSAWFILPVLGVGVAAGIFGLEYLAAERGHRPVATAHALYALLLAALTGVVTAQAMVPFLAAWEVMALCAYLLIMFEQDRSEVRRAGLIYIVLTHLSTLALIGMFAALGANATGRTFTELGVANQAPGTARTLALVFALVGFGLKAGAVPLHFWLPGAHASAPSHVSAVLSGVMLKMGIYGLLRVLLLLGSPPTWFGWTLLGLGMLSGVLGVLWALAQHELKRLLAYHSVENIGIILMGMGVGALGVAYRQPAVAVLGFTGALLHSLNHALFKGLLFLGAGAVLRATGTQVIDELGGLGRALPWTAVCFGVGSIAIVGLPPLNGFVSEWVVFRGLLAAGTSREALRFAIIGVAGLGLIGALALACFTKLDATLFLGQRRTSRPGRQAPADPGIRMLAPMTALAGLCLGIGLLPGLVLLPARLAAGGLVPDAGGLIADAGWSADAARVTLLGLGLILLLVATLGIRRRLAHPAGARLAPTWACAAPWATPRMQYSASSYAAPLLVAFGPVAGVREHRDTDAYRTHAVDLVQDAAVLPLWRELSRVSVRLRAVHGGRLRWYLLWVVFTLLALLYYLPNAERLP